MAWYRLAYRPALLQDFAGLDPILAQRLFDKTKWLASNVENFRHEPIAPDLAVLFKYAAEDWRIFYSIDREDHLVDIHHIVNRKELGS